MKKLMLTAAAVFAFGFANAQEGQGFSKGDLFVSGAFGIGSQKTGDNKSSGFEIEPKIGYFLAENIAIGGKLGYSTFKSENGPIETADETALTVGAFGRYYATPASQFSLFGELAVDYSNVDDNLADQQEKQIGVNLGLGLNYFVSKNFSIEATWAGLGYTSNDNGGDGADKTNTFGLGADLRSINFGLNYKF